MGEIDNANVVAEHKAEAINICDVNGCDELAPNKFDFGCLHARPVDLCDKHAKLFNDNVKEELEDAIVWFLALNDE